MTAPRTRTSRTNTHSGSTNTRRDDHGLRVLAHRDHSPRLGLRRHEAALFVGVGVGTFDDLVRSGITPRPTRFNGCVVWNLRAFERAWDDHAGAMSDDNEWNGLLS